MRSRSTASLPTFMCSRVILGKGSDPLEEAACSSFLEYTHQGALERFARSGRDLGNRGSSSLSNLHIAARDLLEFYISRDVCRHENVCELPIRHEQLGNQINVPVVQPTIFLPWLGAFFVVPISFEQLNLYVSVL